MQQLFENNDRVCRKCALVFNPLLSGHEARKPTCKYWANGNVLIWKCPQCGFEWSTTCADYDLDESSKHLSLPRDEGKKLSRVYRGILLAGSTIKVSGFPFTVLKDTQVATGTPGAFYHNGTNDLEYLVGDDAKPTTKVHPSASIDGSNSGI